MGRVGSRYDVVILSGTDLEAVRAAIAERWLVGDVVAGPWVGRADVAIAELPSSAGTSVVIAAPPMRTPRGIDTRLARRVAAEGFFGTVSDSVGSYAFDVVGEHADRSRSVDAEDDASSERGEPLPEEPLDWPLDEAYVQRLCTLRYGIDPGSLDASAGTWRAIVPVEAAGGADSAGTEPSRMTDPGNDTGRALASTVNPLTRSAPMSDATPAPATPAGRRVRAVVLLAQPPSTIGEVLDILQPGMGAQLQGVPLQGISVTVNGFDVAFALDAQPLVARELDYAVSQSPVRQRVEDAVARHRGSLTLSVAAADDVFGASELLANVTATYADDPNGLAVWLPDADQATTDVLYAGEAARRSAHVWFHTMAARIDEASSIAHTIGVRHLGGIDVQLRSPLAPAEAHGALRDAVATLLEARTMPAEGATVVIAGVPHVLQPAPSMLGMGDVLDAQPVAGAAPTAAGDAAAGERPSGWKRLFGRS